MISIEPIQQRDGLWRADLVVTVFDGLYRPAREERWKVWDAGLSAWQSAGDAAAAGAASLQRLERMGWG